MHVLGHTRGAFAVPWVRGVALWLTFSLVLGNGYGALQELNNGKDHLTFAAFWADMRELGCERALHLPGSVLLHR